LRAAATSSIEDSTSELRNSNDWLQRLADEVEVPRVPVRVLEPELAVAKSTRRAIPASTIHCSVR
jgi:hypothetical protein